MNTAEVLENGLLLLIQVVDGLPEEAWDMPGVCGNWSVKDIVAHLASYEQLILDIVSTFSGRPLSSYAKRWIDDRSSFNTTEVEARKFETAQHVLDEYQNTQVQTASVLMQVPNDLAQKTGTMPWYDPACSLTDLITRMYEHTREHCAQISQFRQRLQPEIKDGAAPE